MRGQFWLSEEQWASIKPHLPYRAAGKRREDDRRIISGNPMAHSGQISVDKLKDLSWVVYTDNPFDSDMILGHFRGQGLPAPEFAIQTTSFNLGLRIVAEGGYVMPIPVQSETTLNPAELCVLRTSPPLAKTPAGAYVHQSSMQYPAIRRLIEIVTEIADG